MPRIPLHGLARVAGLAQDSDDVRMVGMAIEQGIDSLLLLKDLRPIGRLQVGVLITAFCLVSIRQAIGRGLQPGARHHGRGDVQVVRDLPAGVDVSSAPSGHGCTKLSTNPQGP